MKSVVTCMKDSSTSRSRTRFCKKYVYIVFVCAHGHRVVTVLYTDTQILHLFQHTGKVTMCMFSRRISHLFQNESTGVVFSDQVCIALCSSSGVLFLTTTTTELTVSACPSSSTPAYCNISDWDSGGNTSESCNHHQRCNWLWQDNPGVSSLCEHCYHGNINK